MAGNEIGAEGAKSDMLKMNSTLTSLNLESEGRIEGIKSN